MFIKFNMYNIYIYTKNSVEIIHLHYFSINKIELYKKLFIKIYEFK